MRNEVEEKSLAPCKPKTEALVTDFEVIDFAALGPLPADPIQRYIEREKCNHTLSWDFQGWLSEQELAVFHLWPNVPSRERRSIEEKLDNFIFEKAETIGNYIDRCDLIEARIHRWYCEDEDGPRKLERLGAALVRGARVIRGEAKGSRTTYDYRFRERAKKEAKLLIQRLKWFVAQTNGPDSFEKVWAFIESEIKGNPAEFVAFKANLELTKQFMRRLLEERQFRRLLGKPGSGFRLTATEFVNQWMAFSRGVSPDALKWAISLNH